MNLLSSMRYLVALNAHRHFGRAAQACHITQPALSNALRALEREFNVVIVKRDRHFVGLTPEGERVLASAQAMLHETALLQQDLHSDNHLPRGALRMGAVPTALPMAARFAAQLQARCPAIVPTVLSLSSSELEQGLDDLSIDLALGYTARIEQRGKARWRTWPQYTERYFLLRRAAQSHPGGLQIGPAMPWAEAAALPLCLLTPDMHHRTVVDAAFGAAGVAMRPAMETNSILTLALTVVAGTVCSVLSGALLEVVRHDPALEALPLVGPDVHMPIGFMSHAVARPSRALQAALDLAQDADWLRQVAAFSGLQAG
jgi:DNA-binding transcriptional LysR family regulator